MEDLLRMNASNPSCLICLERLNSESSSSSPSSNLKSRQEICVQFSTSVSKFIQMNKKLDIDISQLNTLTFNQENEESNSEKFRTCCENCFVSLEQFCKNYEQLQSLHKELLQTLYGIYLKKKTESPKVHDDDDDVSTAGNDFADDDNHDHDEDNIDDVKSKIADANARNEVTILKVLERPSSHLNPPLNIRRHGLTYKRGGDSVMKKFDSDFGLMATFGKLDRLYYPCLICAKWLPNQPSFLAHMRRHTREKGQICQVCQVEFHYKRNLKCHQIACHTVSTNPKLKLSAVCDQCQASFDNKWSLNRHLINDHKIPKNFICEEPNCGEKFFTLPGLSRHKKIHENPPDNPRPFKCDLCPQRFTLRANLTHHTKKVHRKRRPNLQCDICQVTFEKTFYLNRHRLNDHKMEKKFSCGHPNCEESFFSRQSVLRHRKIHLNPSDDPKPHKCHLCPSKFAFRANLAVHKTRVHGEQSVTRKHLCDLCGKGFHCTGDLLRHHRLMHDPEKPEKVKITYKCDFEGCGKLFSKKFKFEDHALTHTEERNQQCDHCGESFKRERNLKRHILQKHPEVPVFQCKNCSESFHTFPQLRQHRKKFHPYKRIKKGVNVTTNETQESPEAGRITNQND